MRIAIVGSGIAGLVSAYLLSRRHEVTVFEAGDWIGGHTHTVDVEIDQQRRPPVLFHRDPRGALVPPGADGDVRRAGASVGAGAVPAFMK